jgi:hypothetical protein
MFHVEPHFAQNEGRLALRVSSKAYPRSADTLLPQCRGR